MADDTHPEDDRMQLDPSDQEPEHEISSQDLTLYNQLRSKFLARLRQWCVESIKPDKTSRNSSPALLQQHTTFQRRLLKYLDDCTTDADRCDMHIDSAVHAQQQGASNAAGDGTEAAHAYTWPAEFSNDTVDGEILSTLMFVFESLRSQSQQHHKVLDPHRDTSNEELRQLFTECLHRYAEVSKAYFDTIPPHLKNLSQDESQQHKSDFVPTIPQLYLPRNLKSWFTSIEEEKQTCLCVSDTSSTSFLIGSMLVIAMSASERIHVRVTDVQKFPRLELVSEKVQQEHAFEGTMSEFRVHLQEGLSAIHKQKVTAETSIVAIHFIVCSGDAHVYERVQPASGDVMKILDEMMTLPHNQLPCLQQERVVSLVNILDEIERAYVSTSEKQALMTKYHARLGKDLKLVSCASCGVRGLESDNEYGFVNMELPDGFPFRKESEDTEENEDTAESAKTFWDNIPPVFQFKTYPMREDGEPTGLYVDKINIMCRKLRVDKEDSYTLMTRELQIVDKAEQDHVRELFNVRLEQENYGAEELKTRRAERKQLRDSIEKPPWAAHLHPEQLQRYQEEQCIRSRYWCAKTAQYYWLHPELVQIDEKGGIRVKFDLCSKCRHHLTQPETKKTPNDWLALCNGHDFGWGKRVNQLGPPLQDRVAGIPPLLPNLPTLTLIEDMIVAKVRITCALLKLTVRNVRGRGQVRIPGHVGHGNQVTYLKGQCVATHNIEADISVGRDAAASSQQADGGGDNAQESASFEWSMLSAEKIANRVNVYFMVQGRVGPARRDRLAELMIQNEALQVRRYHILRHLYFHHRNTPGYQNLGSFQEIEREAQFTAFTQNLHTRMKSNMHVENDDSIRAKEAELTSDITGGHAGLDSSINQHNGDAVNESADGQPHGDVSMHDASGGAGPSANPPGGDAMSALLAAVTRQGPCEIAHDLLLTGSGTDDACIGRYLLTDHEISNQPVWVHESYEYILGFHVLHDGGVWTVRHIDVTVDHSEIENLQLGSVRLTLDTTRAWHQVLEATESYSECITEPNASISIVNAPTGSGCPRLAWSEFLKARDALAAEANIPRDGDGLVPVIMNYVQLTDVESSTDGDHANRQYFEKVKEFVEAQGKLDTADIPDDGDPMSTSSKSDSDDAESDTGGPARHHNVDSAGSHGDEAQHTSAAEPAGGEAQQPAPSFHEATIRLLSSNELMESKYETDEILYGGFPQLFPLGTGLEKHKTGLTRALLKHFLCHFTTAFAENSHFVFYVFNCHIRTLNNTAAYIALKDRQDAPQIFEEFISDPSFLQKARNAARFPNCKDAKEVSRIVNPYLQMTGAQMPFSDAEKQRFSNEAWAMFHFYGEPSYFATASPEKDAWSFRFSYPTVDPSKFPATNVVDESRDFRDVFEQEGQFQFPAPSAHVEWKVPMNIDLSCFKLAQFASDHPVGCVEMFSRILESIIEILIGLRPLNSRKSTYKTAGAAFGLQEDKLCKKGIFGYARAIAGCAECSGRDAVHTHLVVWSRLMPMHIQWAAGNEPLMQRIARVIESHLFAHIPAEYHVQDLLNKMTPFEKREKPPRFGCKDAPDIFLAQTGDGDESENVVETHGDQQAPDEAEPSEEDERRDDQKSPRSAAFKKHVFSFATRTHVSLLHHTPTHTHARTHTHTHTQHTQHTHTPHTYAQRHNYIDT